MMTEVRIVVTLAGDKLNLRETAAGLEMFKGHILRFIISGK